MAPYLAAALGAFRLLIRDYERLHEYVHPDSSNASTYSHRTYELLLRACTEFESLSKAAAIELQIPVRGSKPTIQDLAVLYAALDLQAIEVVVTPWVPTPLVVRPLDGWDTNPHTLGWYRAYNNVKHNRAVQFSEASLLNVTHAIAACFSMLVRLGAIKVEMSGHVHLPQNYVEFGFSELPLAVRVHESWKLINGGYPTR